uniref:Phosphate transporter PHO1 homolog 10-like n=1 Tax=Nelumbo nucifera TaxID=4432 RepID=A0A822YWI3_NELNU|nr:TPA_asm: hypothetical protein HUJ06_007693 [Nelumbo nucifera]
MKFRKEFSEQMVTEWQEAYVDYNGLRRLLKEIMHFEQKKKPATHPEGSQNRIHRAFSRLTYRGSNLKSSHGDVENQEIDAGDVQRDDSKRYYETRFLMPADASEHEIMFFRKLNDEFNKVNMFYKDKVKEVMDEASLLHKQMDALIALRIKVKNPDSSDSNTIKHLKSDVSAMELSKVSTPYSDRKPGFSKCAEREPMDLIHEEMKSRGQMEEHTEDACNKKLNTGNYGPAPEILRRVKIKNTRETPLSTIKGVLKDSEEEELSYKKEELRQVEERLKIAFTEFYQKLLLLKRFNYMNLLAFSKIIKKHDKITSRNASRPYLETLDHSYIGSSDEVLALLERVEGTFIKYFSNSNPRKGLKSLRPKARREKHRITFFSGFLSGCTLALVVALCLIIHSRNLIDRKEEGSLYMENMFPLYSLFAFIVLHMLLYAANIYFWRRYRVNYRFIFDFKQGTELGHREVFLLSAGLAVLSLATAIANLDMEMDSKTQNYKELTELVPLGLLVVLLAIMFCPFNIIYRSSRFFLIKCLFRCICAPLYKVTLPDHFMADQLTSQIQAIRSIEFYICYYGWGDFSRRQNKCHSRKIYNFFYFIVAVIPYWSRFLQCLRRLFEEKHAVHGYNGLRYFITLVAMVLRTAYELKKGINWRVMAAISYAIATSLNTYWDIVMDWGLLRWRSKNRWLRDKLLVPYKSVYFIAMAVNILLRFAWMQQVFEFQIPNLHHRAVVAIVNCLEILRRGNWNFFWLENEHLNNVGKYRAFKSVPLPFNYYDEDQGKDD